MKMKSLFAASLLVFALSGASAQAATMFIDPGANEVLNVGTQYNTSAQVKGPLQAFSDTYSFVVMETSLPPDGTENVAFNLSATYSDPSIVSNLFFGIADLTVTLFDVTYGSAPLGTVQLTDSAGFALPGFETGYSVQALLLSSIQLDVIVSGIGLGNGGLYNFTIEDLGDLSAVPVPAALPLMLSGMGALGLFGYRRRKAVA